MDALDQRGRRRGVRGGALADPDFALAVRAVGVGIDPERLLQPGQQFQRLVTRALIEHAETAEAARQDRLADQITYRLISGFAEFAVAVGWLKRKSTTNPDE